jgi:predicted SAM-dependent methyltransferase
LNHVLEHLGRDTEIYFGIIKEIYRVIIPDGKVIIVAPHPRHDDFINDPTHIRMITPEHMTPF